MSWWENDGAGGGWTKHVVDLDFDVAFAVATADVNGNGRMDILGGASLGDDVTWWENDGSACAPACSWPEHRVDGDFDSAKAVAAADVDGDGDMDVLAAGSAKVSWWENDGTAYAPTCSWAEHVLVTGLLDADSIWAGDLDGDGDNGPPIVVTPIGPIGADTGAILDIDVSSSFFDEEGGLTFSALGLPLSLSMTTAGSIVGSVHVFPVLESDREASLLRARPAPGPEVLEADVDIVGMRIIDRDGVDLRQ